jgi:hypothetical protein
MKFKQMMIGVALVTLLAAGAWAEAQPPGQAVGQDFSAEVTTTYAWADHMPQVGKRAGGRHYLTMTVKLTNPGKADLVVELTGASVSFAKDKKGDATKEIRIEGGKENVTNVTVKAGESKSVDLRGNDAYPAGHDGETLYVTLEFKGGKTTLAVSGQSKVTATF